LGGRKGIRPVKKLEWWGAGMVICLERGADLHMAQMMSLPLTVSCFSKIQIGFTFLVPAHPGSPGKGPLNGCVCVCVYENLCNDWCHSCIGQLHNSHWTPQRRQSYTHEVAASHLVSPSRPLFHQPVCLCREFSFHCWTDVAHCQPLMGCCPPYLCQQGQGGK